MIEQGLFLPGTSFASAGDFVYNLFTMNFLITGAAGFHRFSLANQLAREGHQVRGLDDLSTGDPQALAPDVHFTRGDVNDRPKLWTLLQEVDCVYHLAARVSVPESNSTRANTTPSTWAARSA